MQTKFFSWATILLGVLNLLPSAAGAETAAQSPAAQAIRKVGGHVLPVAANDPRLEVSLNLARDVQDEALTPVSELKDVVWLNLAGTKITDGGLAKISGLKSLERLHLERTGIGDEGVAHLKRLENLVYLNLYGTKVTDAGLKHLSDLKKLKRLYLWQTEVTDEGVKSLKEALPELQIIRGVEFTPVAPPVEEPKKPEEEKKPEAEKKPEEPKKPDAAK